MTCARFDEMPANLGELMLRLAGCWDDHRWTSPLQKADAAPAPSTAASAAPVTILDSFITSPLLFSLVHACRSTLDRLGLMIEGMHYQGSCERLILCGAIVARNP
jgi:hypothetical protein